MLNKEVNDILKLFVSLNSSSYMYFNYNKIPSLLYLSHCQNSSKFLSVSYLMKTANVIMNFFSSHNTTDHT